MSDFRGHIAYNADALTEQDQARAGAPFLGAGLSKPRVWRDACASLALAQRIVTAEDRVELQPVADAAGRVVLFDGYLFDPAALKASGARFYRP